MIEITLEEGDRIDWALKTFKRKVQKAGVLAEVRKRRHYVKPSIAKALKSDAARRRARSRSRGQGGGGNR
jgi:small subunit ribosomal protein S21